MIFGESSPKNKFLNFAMFPDPKIFFNVAFFAQISIYNYKFF